MKLTAEQERVHVRIEVGRNTLRLAGGHFVSTRGHLRGNPCNNGHAVLSIRNYTYIYGQLWAGLGGGVAFVAFTWCSASPCLVS